MQKYPIPRLPTLLAGALAIGAVATVAAPLAAQDLPPAPRGQGMGGEADRIALNREQAEFARFQLDRNARSKAEFERARADFQAAQSKYDQALVDIEATKSRIAEDDAKAWAAYQAEKARIEADYAAARARWQADVAACKAGDSSRCSKSG